MTTNEAADASLLLSDSTAASSSDDKHDSSSISSSWLSMLGPPYMANILITELCERYSYYALRAILVLFFNEKLSWSESSSVAVVFFSASLTYFMPLVGGYAADAKMGKYRAILWFCVIYIFGSATLTVGAFAESAGLAIFGLTLIALGTGGIKPNVSSFGADQLADCTVDVRERFFRVFYFSINVGSVFSYVLSPLLRKHAGYGVAFGVPTVFLCIATVTFWLARTKYVKNPPEGSPIAVVARTIAAARKRRSSSTPIDRSQHWIERAREEPGVQPKDVHDTLAVWRVGVVLSVLPIFWMLYDQQASSWTLQAGRMKLHGLEPEQMGVTNPLVILILIPIFDQFIYRKWDKYLPRSTQLRRIGFGMLVCAVAFVLAALLEAIIASQGEGNVTVFLQLPQIIVLSVSEILVSITGLEFAYDQAPKSMKSSVMALFLLTTAIGDLIGGGLYSGLGSTISPAGLFVICAIAMVLNTFLFVYVARRFVPYVTESHTKSPASDENEEDTRSIELSKFDDGNVPLVS